MVNERAQRLAKRLQRPVFAAALLVIPVVLLEQADRGATWRRADLVLNTLIWLVFAAEFAATLAVADDRRRWLRSRPFDLAIVLLTPPVAPAFMQAGRAFRLLRVARLLRPAIVSRRYFTLHGMRWAIALSVFMAFGAGAAFTVAERDQHLSAWDGIYWALTTMATVGYGDIGPHTDLGKAIALVVMLTGIGLIGVLAGAMSHLLLRDEQPAQAAAVDAQVLEHLADISTRLAHLETLAGGSRDDELREARRLVQTVDRRAVWS